MGLSTQERHKLQCDACGKDGDFWTDNIEELKGVHAGKGWLIEEDIPHVVVCSACCAIGAKLCKLGLLVANSSDFLRVTADVLPY